MSLGSWNDRKWNFDVAIYENNSFIQHAFTECPLQNNAECRRPKCI